MTESSNNRKSVDFALHFDGEPAEVEAETFVTTVLSITKILEELNSAFGVDERLHIRVRAPKPGSLLLPLSLVTPEIIDTIKSLFTKDNIKLASELIVFLGTLFNLRKRLKNSKPEVVKEQDGEVVIKNNNDSTIVVNKGIYNFYVTNPKVNPYLDQAFRSLEKDKSVSAFEIHDSEGRSIFNRHYPK